MSHLTKTEMSLVIIIILIWLNIVTIVVQVSTFCQQTCACAKMSTPLFNCTENDGLVSAMPNIQKTLLQFTTLV